MADGHETPERGFSRRTFLKGAGGVTAAGLVVDGVAAEPAQTGPQVLRGSFPVELTINGEKHELEVEPRTTLLSALRHRLELTGTKEVCDRGNCGACTVMVDGKPAYSCLLLAVDVRGRDVRTVEGLAEGGELSPVQKAFCEKDGQMCGFCTPGFVVATTAALEASPGANLDEIKQRLSGNLCRCGTYPHVFDAALAAQREQGGR